MKRIVLLSGCLAVMAAQAGDLYRWTDARGRVHYGDAPPPDAAQVKPIRSPATDMPGEELSYEVRRARQNFPVTLYVAENCGEYCQQARSLLNQRGIPFTEKVFKTKEEIDAFRALSGSDITPTLGVGRTFLKGFLSGQWHNELDIAGYPKTAPYRVPSAPVPAASGVAPANPGSAGQAATQ